jgi:hypothetical protein
MAPSALGQEAQPHLLTLCRYWGAAESGGGSQEHAPYLSLLESSMLHTGAPARDAKASGK